MRWTFPFSLPGALSQKFVNKKPAEVSSEFVTSRRKGLTPKVMCFSSSTHGFRPVPHKTHSATILPGIATPCAPHHPTLSRKAILNRGTLTRKMMNKALPYF
jgi:hypothetical protein